MWLIAAAALAEQPLSAGLHELTLAMNDKQHRYTVVLPEDPTKRGKKVPVIVALHYGGHGAPHYATGFVRTLIEPGLSSLGAIVIAPDCPADSWAQPVSQAVVLSLLDHAIEAWNGDPDRVLVTGYSLGAMGTWALADAHPTRFAAALPVAGNPGKHAATIRVPTYAIHGEKDALIPPAPSAKAIRSLKARGVEAFWVELAALTHYETGRYAPALEAAIPWIQRQLKLD